MPGVEAVAWCEVGFSRQLCEFVPRATQLAVVATEDTVADRAAEFDGDRAGQFDRQVGDATTGIESVGRDDGIGRANVDAGAAGAAVIGGRDCRFEWQVCVDFTEQKP